MLFQGDSITVGLLDDGIVELSFNAKGSVNKFDQATFIDFKAAIAVFGGCYCC